MKATTSIDTPKEVYEASTVEDRLNFAERAIGLMISELKQAADASGKDGRRARKGAIECYKAGEITDALQLDSIARGNERAARELNAVLRTLKNWQGYSDTPSAQLPFPV